MRCSYSKVCEGYRENSHTCNEEQITDDGYIYCGKYREYEIEKQNKGERNEI